MGYSTAAKNAAINGIVALGNWMTLHTGDPGATGASEGAGVTRAQSTYPGASGSSTTGSQAVIAVPPGTYTHWGQWSASTAGTFITGGALSASEVYGVAGTYGLTPTLNATG